MPRDIIVLGAGMVGVSAAYHLVRRGHRVCLIDRREPGRETSFGNAGIIQREAVEPYAFPHDLKTLFRILPNRSIDIRYRPPGVAAAADALWKYWLNSFPERYERIVPEYASLIALSTQAHAPMIEEAGAKGLVAREGWLELYRSAKALDKRVARAQRVHARHGVEFAVLDQPELLRREPHLSRVITGAIHWQNAWTVASPGDLVKTYADLVGARGGTLMQADITALEPTKGGWRVGTSEGPLEASDVVVALGPWTGDWIEPLGYRLPLFAKRGYHMHYARNEARPLNHWVMDAEVGYLVEPMKRGVRLTTGAELERRDSPARSGQLDAAEKVAREIYPPLGRRLDETPWKGARPCMSDMKPVIGAAPRHDGLWFDFGHGHQGFTLGPATGCLLAQLMEGEPPIVDPRPFSPERFG